MALDRKRLLIYSVALLLCLVCAGAARPHGAGYWTATAPSLVVIVLSCVAPRLAFDPLPQAAVLSSALAGLLESGGGLTAAILSPLDLLPALTLAIGSRVLAVRTRLRHRQFYLERELALGSAPRQSAAAALLLGLALVCLFYGLFDLRAPGSADPALGVMLAAIHGTTVIHRAIVALFFVILAFLMDAFLIQLADRTAAIAVLSSAQDGPGELDRALAREGHRGLVRQIADALDHSGPRASEDTQATLALEQASRRFVRGLVPLLPLLGFLGTVIGLARALGDFKLGQEGAGAPDFSGVLSGLAVKFETTLLGLVTSMLASLLLAWMEKHGSELSAECRLAAARISQRGKIDA